MTGFRFRSNPQVEGCQDVEIGFFLCCPQKWPEILFEILQLAEKLLYDLKKLKSKEQVDDDSMIGNYSRGTKTQPATRNTYFDWMKVLPLIAKASQFISASGNPLRF